jgi:hypothetical protein
VQIAKHQAGYKGASEYHCQTVAKVSKSSYHIMGCNHSKEEVPLPPKIVPSSYAINNGKNPRVPQPAATGSSRPVHLTPDYLEYALPILSHLKNHVVELVVDDTTEPEQPEHRAIRNWTSLLISVLRSNPHRKYQVSFLHYGNEGDFVDNKDLNAIIEVLNAITWKDMLDVELSADIDEECGVRSRLGQLRDERNGNLKEGLIYKEQAIEDMKDAAKRYRQKHFQDPWDQMQVSEFESEWKQACKWGQHNQLDITNMIDLLQARYTFQAEQRQTRGISRPMQKIVIFVVGGQPKDFDKVKTIVKDAQRSNSNPSQGGLNLQFFSVAQSANDVKSLIRLDKLGRNEDDNVDTTWVPAPFTKFPPPSKVLEKVLIAGTIAEYDRMPSDCRCYYSKDQQDEVKRLMEMPDIEWNPPPYDEREANPVISTEMHKTQLCS